jgi:hypothetical protein
MACPRQTLWRRSARLYSGVVTIDPTPNPPPFFREKWGRGPKVGGGQEMSSSTSSREYNYPDLTLKDTP